MLTSLQRRILRVTRMVVPDEQLVLAGGAALIEHAVVDRPTRDVDLFAIDADVVDRSVDLIVTALEDDGLRVERVRSMTGFHRLLVADGASATCEVDLGVDARLFDVVHLDVGATLSLDELAADKTLALFGRAEARDFVDVAALLEHGYAWSRLCELAAAKDSGFSIDRLLEALRAFGRLDAAEFPGREGQRELLATSVKDWTLHLADPSAK